MEESLHAGRVKKKFLIKYLRKKQPFLVADNLHSNHKKTSILWQSRMAQPVTR